MDDVQPDARCSLRDVLKSFSILAVLTISQPDSGADANSEQRKDASCVAVAGAGRFAWMHNFHRLVTRWKYLIEIPLLARGTVNVAYKPGPFECASQFIALLMELDCLFVRLPVIQYPIHCRPFTRQRLSDSARQKRQAHHQSSKD